MNPINNAGRILEDQKFWLEYMKFFPHFTFPSHLILHCVLWAIVEQVYWLFGSFLFGPTVQWPLLGWWVVGEGHTSSNISNYWADQKTIAPKLNCRVKMPRKQSYKSGGQERRERSTIVGTKSGMIKVSRENLMSSFHESLLMYE